MIFPWGTGRFLYPPSWLNFVPDCNNKIVYTAALARFSRKRIRLSFYNWKFSLEVVFVEQFENDVSCGDVFVTFLLLLFLIHHVKYI